MQLFGTMFPNLVNKMEDAGKHIVENYFNH